MDSKDFEEVDHVKRNILQLYRNDIYQYAGEQASKVIQIWDSVPSQLHRSAKRFRIGALEKGARKREYSEAFFWLDEARVVNTCYAATQPSIGLKLNRDDARYKLYLGDTGLLLSHTFDQNAIRNDELYRKLMLGKLEINKGMFIENLTAQQLRSAGHPLYYYAKTDRENAENNMEIDFLVRKPVTTSRHNINAIEVKSTQRYTTSSLNKFEKRFKNYINEAIILHSGDLRIEEDRLYLPLYMGGLI